MKKNHILTLVALVLGHLIQSSALAGELLKNPGFEDPIARFDNVGWDVRGPQEIRLSQITDPVIEGRYALLVEGRSDRRWEGIKQAVSLEPGKTYRLSGSIRLAKGEKNDNGAVQLIKELDDGTKLFQPIIRSRLSASRYTSFSETFSFGEKNVKETVISIHGMEDGKSFIVDGFSLKEVK